MDKVLRQSERLSTLFAMIQAVSVDPDPVSSTGLFVRTMRDVYNDIGVITIGSRNAPKGFYRLTRLLHQPGIVGEKFQEQEHHPSNAPLFSGGFLGEVMKIEEPRVLEGLRIENDPVLGDQLSPYRAFLVLPIITLGKVGGQVLQFSTDPETFTSEVIEARFVTASLLGSLLHAKKVALDLDEAEAVNDRLQAQSSYLGKEIALKYDFEGIVFESGAFKRVLRNVEQVAQTDATVLILGESGTGKELLAHAVHRLSRRGRMPLIKVNCAALAENLIESELFGHEKGAFTGALKSKIGRFELANGGTIFLDEVGELAPDLQAKLLRVLQEGEFERLGGTTTRKVDVRVIAATNRDLQADVESGRFREDIYYRLNVFPLVSPPLRERKEDIPILVRHFTAKFSGEMGREVQQVPLEAMNTLKSYGWPGNVRELQNIIERAVILSEGRDLELDQAFGAALTKESKTVGATTLADNEKQFVLDALKSCGWRIQGPDGAAARLELSPSTLRSRMKRLGINRI